MLTDWRYFRRSFLFISLTFYCNLFKSLLTFHVLLWRCVSIRKPWMTKWRMMKSWGQTKMSSPNAVQSLSVVQMLQWRQIDVRLITRKMSCRDNRHIGTLQNHSRMFRRRVHLWRGLLPPLVIFKLQYLDYTTSIYYDN